MPDLRDIEAEVAAVAIDTREAEIARLEAKLAKVREVVNDAAPAEERIQWLRDYLA